MFSLPHIPCQPGSDSFGSYETFHACEVQPMLSLPSPSGHPLCPMSPLALACLFSWGVVMSFCDFSPSQGMLSTIRLMELAASSMPSAASTVMLTASRAPAPPLHLQCPLPLHLCLPCFLAVITSSLPGRWASLLPQPSCDVVWVWVEPWLIASTTPIPWPVSMTCLFQ